MKSRLGAFVFAALIAGCTHDAQSVLPIASHVEPAMTKPNYVPGGQYQHGQVQHVVMITMENRSFDEYFGTYPGVNGLPSPLPCIPDPNNNDCVTPYHDTALVNHGGPHGVLNEAIDLDGGKMDGFIKAAELQHYPYPTQVMGYHTCHELPYYCFLAQHGTLADNFYAATTSWSTMAHLFSVSGWSAKCSVKGDPMSCVSDNNVIWWKNPDYAWTDITWLLHSNNVSWGYFVYDTTNPFVEGDGDDESPTEYDVYNKMGIWNPLPSFDDVTIDNQIGNIQPGVNFDADAVAGTLPAVSWVEPTFATSDHPTANISSGEKWVQTVINEVENGPDAQSTLIILSWDEWGGFYDHVVPPAIDGLGYGFRVPMILYGPMVKMGRIDHQLLSSDAFLKFIENQFLGGARIDSNDGRPDSRPDVRENAPGLGDISNDLN